MRLLFALLAAAFPLAAQFANLATDDAGDRVWFSSALGLKGTQQTPLPKIFVSDSQGNVQLVAQSDRLLTNPEASGDGRVLAYQSAYDCPLGATCRQPDQTQSVVGNLVLPGIFHLSHNGRYVAREGYDYFGPTGQFEVIDLTTQQRRDILVQDFQIIGGGGRQVTSGGAVLAYSGGLWLFQPDGGALYIPGFSIPSAFYTYPTRAALDDAGVRVVFESSAGCYLNSNIYPMTLVQSDQPCTLQNLSADGSLALYLSSDGGLMQCFLINTTTLAIQRVSQDAAGIAEATLSGNGQVIWASTSGGRILRIDLSTGVTREVIAQATAVDQNPYFSAIIAGAGALAHLTGRGLSGRLLADGQPVPIVSATPTDIVFQVPWELTGYHTLTLQPAASASPFEGVLTRLLEVRPMAPNFWYVVHQDFHGLVTPSDPAHPDEILHLYLTGLGPATPAVATGQVTPSSPLSILNGPIYVFWQGALPANFPLAVKVLFAGLAPGTIGLDQVDVQVPHEAPAQLSISVQGGSGGAVATFAVAP
jgi:uncharacterized protein (TIGR03437 family)